LTIMASLPPYVPGESFADRYNIARPAATSKVNEAASELLLHATQQGDPAMAQALLVESGANPSYRNALGETCLHVAAHRGVESVVDVLLRFGADPNVTMEPRYGGRTPLHVAVRQRHARLVVGFLDFGADANIADAFGKLPLHDAAALGDEACVRALLTRGSVASAMDQSGRTPADYAAKGQHDRCRDAIDAAVAARSFSDEPPAKGGDATALSNMVNPTLYAARAEALNKRVVWREKKPPPKKK
jgi:ankyrin repeat protein